MSTVSLHHTCLKSSGFALRRCSRFFTRNILRRSFSTKFPENSQFETMKVIYDYRKWWIQRGLSIISVVGSGMLSYMAYTYVQAVLQDNEGLISRPIMSAVVVTLFGASIAFPFCTHWWLSRSIVRIELQRRMHPDLQRRTYRLALQTCGFWRQGERTLTVANFMRGLPYKRRAQLPPMQVASSVAITDSGKTLPLLYLDLGCDGLKLDGMSYLFQVSEKLSPCLVEGSEQMLAAEDSNFITKREGKGVWASG
eukprot:46114_1